MDRRTFLSSTMIGGLGLLGLANRAEAFTTNACGADANAQACKTVATHAELRERLAAFLEQKGLNAEERAAILARSTCPFCGGPLS